MVQILLSKNKNSKSIPVKIYAGETTAELNQKAIQLCETYNNGINVCET
jgi:hypothetical protein